MSTVAMSHGARSLWRRAAVKAIALAVVCPYLLLALARAGEAQPEKIIIDTDIGTDIDDAFAIALALRSPELDILGFTTVSGNTTARARILDRMLAESGHANIPVAVGQTTSLRAGWPGIGRQGRYGEQGHFTRTTYLGAVDFILEQIRRYPGQVTLVAIGPLTTVGALIDKDRETFRELRRVVMMGGEIGPINFGPVVGMTTAAIPEYNIAADIPAAQKLFKSGVPIYAITQNATINLKLDEVKRDIIFSQSTPLTDSLTLLYHLWGFETPILNDPMAVAFVIDPKQCPVKPAHIRVDNDGVTRIELGPQNVEICLHSDRDLFLKFYVHRLMGEPFRRFPDVPTAHAP